MLRLLATLPLAGLLLAQQDAPAKLDPARSFFAGSPVVRVQITLDDAARKSLKGKPREYARATLQLDGETFAEVGVKLKGAAGSFQELHERPGFTVNLGKFGGKGKDDKNDKDARFHGLGRFHLNNGAQDGSRLCEWIGHDVFTAAKLPAPRVAHAIVRLDDRLLGLYVFRESFDKQFLLRNFGDAHGNLYDGGFCQDLDAELQKDSGDGPDDRSDLQALCELCRGVDQTRAAKLQTAIDVPGFVDFIALEAMLGHWDGYSQKANNFRVWLPTNRPSVFLPHGMDQLFGDSEASILEHTPSLAASAVLQQPAFRKRYRERLKTLLPLFAPTRLTPRVQAVADGIQRALKPVDADLAREHDEAVRDLLGRIDARYRSLQEQVKAPEPKPLPLAKGKPFVLRTWHPAAEQDGLELDKKGAGGTPSLQIQVKRRSEEAQRGYWHTRVLLGPGRYELRGMVRCLGVQPPPKDQDGNEQGGVFLRVDGEPSQRLRGDAAWQSLVRAFEVGEFQRSVELACELHAIAGQAWFRVDSLQLVRVGD